ncbi:thiamine pyrophosphate-binding protein [Arsenicitalea aurantiaca]|uniref:Thiamine pyrophosphate-binding protein n=1 Tax=Arsenicitalea aurantiaca TaxID=1783274 RepID=A0A433XL12_9HYPH|nr:thiamine pyrophosphate-binding protein [Arsenicitalea aurantiaca]RUT34688.1 thiamine pyrophosphate-binding protein [Arsenicitalea aurantiaca]
MERQVEAHSGKALYGSDVMVTALRELGAEYVFINPGSSFRGIHDSLVNYLGNERPEIVLVTHEMIAVAMAHGYAKATGRPGFVILHNLVGLMNGSMSIFNAFCDQTPLVIIGGSGPADPKDRRFIDWAHSANTQGDLVRPYVKWTDEPVTLEGALDSMLRAHRKAMTAPMGPTYVSLDAGLQEIVVEPGLETGATLPRYQAPAPIHPDPALVEEIAAALLSAEMPLIVGGRFGINPEVTAPLVRLVELTGAAYLDDRVTVCFPTRHPQNLNGDKAIRKEADLILALDVQDLTLATVGYSAGRSAIMGTGAGAAGATVIDVSLNDYFGNSWSRFGGPTPPIDRQLIADPLLSLKLIVSAVEARIAQGAESRAITDRRHALAKRHDTIAAAHRDTLAKRSTDNPIAMERLTQSVFDAVRGEKWRLVVRNHRSWKDGYWEFSGAGDYLGGDGGGGVGYGPGAAIGAAMGLKGTGVLPVAIIGDGDFMMTPGAIWSGVHHETPLLMVIMNNRSWGNDELHQREVAHVRGRAAQNAHVGQRTHHPDVDLVGVARSFGAWTRPVVTDPAELDAALAEGVAAVKAGHLAVIEVITSLD